jgi:glycosyltransferase involved in cell wall biosynthesis
MSGFRSLPHRYVRQLDHWTEYPAAEAISGWTTETHPQYRDIMYPTDVLSPSLLAAQAALGIAPPVATFLFSDALFERLLEHLPVEALLEHVQSSNYGVLWTALLEAGASFHIVPMPVCELSVGRSYVGPGRVDERERREMMAAGCRYGGVRPPGPVAATVLARVGARPGGRTLLREPARALRASFFGRLNSEAPAMFSEDLLECATGRGPWAHAQQVRRSSASRRLRRLIRTVVGKSLDRIVPARRRRAAVSHDRRARARDLATRILERNLAPRIHEAAARHPQRPRSVREVLQINTEATAGGAARIVSVLHDGLTDSRIQSTRMVAPRALATAREDPTFIGVPALEGSLQQELREVEKERGWLDLLQLGSLRISRTDAFARADLVHFHNLHGAYFSPYAIAEISSRKPAVWTLHDMQAITGHCASAFDCTQWISGCLTCPYLSVYPRLQRDTVELLWNTKHAIYGAVQFAVVTPSLWLLNKVKRSVLRDQNLRMIYNGIDEAVFQPVDPMDARRALGLPHDQKIIVFAASSSDRDFAKGGWHVERTYRNLEGRADLLFIRLGGSSTPGYRTSSWREEGYIDQAEQLALYYAAADAFLYPSLAESFGLVVAEAMACNTPVVAFDVGGIPEIIGDAPHRGTCVPVGNTTELTKALVRYIDGEVERSGDRQSGHERVVSRFTETEMVERYKDLYSEVATGR